MKQITKNIMTAFINGEAKTIGNSYTNGNEVFLFDNKIAERKDGKLFIYDGGYTNKYDCMSVTTKERLNGLLELLKMDARIWQENKKNVIAHGFYGDRYWTINLWTGGAELKPETKEVVTL